ncbi:MAG TPA: flagellar export chaperone FlgN, partial [Phycisphaerales bacterium]|nr:flagellar export chaperone FlgN [Phycisphaerales bacterium]
ALLADLEIHARDSALLADEHRAAISTADPAALARCVAAQQQAAAHLNQLEARRAAFLRSLGLRAPAQGGQAVTLTQLAALAPKPRAAALTAAAARVRTLLADAAQRRESVRLAGLSLMAHMQGIMRQITRNLSDTKTYAPPTARPAGLGVIPNGTLDFMT